MLPVYSENNIATKNLIVKLERECLINVANEISMKENVSYLKFDGGKGRIPAPSVTGFDLCCGYCTEDGVERVSHAAFRRFKGLSEII